MLHKLIAMRDRWREDARLQELLKGSAEARRFVHQRRVDADELDALIQEYGWQPIETAPKRRELRCILGHPYSVVTGYWDGYGWRNERGPRDSYFPATHWRPLPDPPAEQKE